jgi:hypothetical protein
MNHFNFQFVFSVEEALEEVLEVNFSAGSYYPEHVKRNQF